MSLLWGSWAFLTNHALWCARWTIWFKYNSHANKHGNSRLSEAWLFTIVFSYNSVSDPISPSQTGARAWAPGFSIICRGRGDSDFLSSSPIVISHQRVAGSASREDTSSPPQIWPIKASVFDLTYTCVSFFLGGGWGIWRVLKKETPTMWSYCILPFIFSPSSSSPPPPPSLFTLRTWVSWHKVRCLHATPPTRTLDTPFFSCNHKNKCQIFSTAWKISTSKKILW